ncbi:dihydrodipicolinate synthase family protein [Frigidibacter sp. ROC022]|uniref:dihydrodipicolinate synthase family protein n=1 Tax=Frigidibacter sp. ROC022 TaxID=2971796 RepID=UPI00215A6099|nr:dihydrodipicolinate synthase family protein [Frigidibacter sp. ROC022]MCR8724996.1 dihydrodipicolinate synthase family protein [Frigidibacter sp. ROC022]
MQGIIAAVPTPIDASGAPIRELFVEHCRWALANGCDGLNVLGSTGEANSFDGATRGRVMGWAAEELGGERLMVGTGTPSLAETVALTTEADRLGFAVALVLPPYYYKPATDDGLYRWYMALHAALGARPIRLYFYNFPQMTGIVISQSVIERLHRAAPERFCGIKDSSGDLAYCRGIASALPGFIVLPSSETSLPEARSSGFAGCISATVNLSAPLCGRLWAGETGLADRIATIRGSVSAQPLIPAIKYLVGRRSGDPSWEEVLPPFTALTAQARAALDAIDLSHADSAVA